MRLRLSLVIALFLFSLLVAGCGGSRKNTLNTLIANNYSATVTLVRKTPATNLSAIRVTLTAKNHQPHPSESPRWHWWYCVKVRTAAGKAVTAPVRLLLQIVSGRTPVGGVGLVSLRDGYGRRPWCAAIGGKGNVLDALPRGKQLAFQAVVRVSGVTVKRNWRIIVRAQLLSRQAIGGVRLGTPRAEAVAKLSALFGHPSRADFVNHACAPTYTEIAWKHLYVEFRRGRLSGYRYIQEGWPRTSPGKSQALSNLPRLATSGGISLGSTLATARAAYGHLRAVGTNRWQTPDGLVLYDNATHYPDPPSSRIVEIKTLGACGDF